MREARITLPDHPYTSTGAAYLRRVLLERFGGYTETHGNGAWEDRRTGKVIQEPVRVWDVALAPSPENEALLREAAATAGLLADQGCVYLRQADGEVELVPVPVKH